MTDPFRSRAILWAVLALPGALLVAAWAGGTWSYGQAVSLSGQWSAELLIVTMVVTPLRRLLGATVLTRFLVRRRRDLGVASFAYALLHLLVYLIRKADAVRIWAEAQEPWLAAGWVAFVVLAALAATSTDAAVRAMGTAWKSLHRAVYLAALLVFLHWLISAFDPLSAILHLAVLAVLQATRAIPRRR